MALPLLAPLIGGMLGTAAAPALGVGSAVAAGLGSGIGSLAAGAEPEEALFAGLTGGVGSKIMPGIMGAAGKGGEAAASAAASGGGQAASQGPDVMKALQTGAQFMGGGGGGETPASAPSSAPMNLSGGQQGGGAAIPQLTQPDPPQAPAAAPTVPEVDTAPSGGIASFAEEELRRRGLSSIPNLGDPETARNLASNVRGEFAMGGFVEGPGTGTSDDVPATIYQDGEPVEDAALSDGEFVMTADAVKGAGGGDRKKGAAEMYRMMRQFEERAA
ncbi:MAG: hypothetical protein R6V05_03920 [Candidatus Brocadiia bacterium]